MLASATMAQHQTNICAQLNTGADPGFEKGGGARGSGACFGGIFRQI